MEIKDYIIKSLKECLELKYDSGNNSFSFISNNKTIKKQLLELKNFLDVKQKPNTQIAISNYYIKEDIFYFIGIDNIVDLIGKELYFNNTTYMITSIIPENDLWDKALISQINQTSNLIQEKETISFINSKTSMFIKDFINLTDKESIEEYIKKHS